MAGLGGLVNPFHVSTVCRGQNPEAPPVDPQREARQLADAYRRALDVVEEAFAQIEQDQERFALLLQAAQTAYPPDDLLDTQVFLFRDGLELRLRELDEESRRLAAVERRLDCGIEDAEVALELETIEAAGLVDPRLLERLEQQQRVIRLQRDELEQARFERDVLEDDRRRLREACEYELAGDDVDYGEHGLDVETTRTAEIEEGAEALLRRAGFLRGRRGDSGQDLQAQTQANAYAAFLEVDVPADTRTGPQADGGIDTRTEPQENRPRLRPERRSQAKRKASAKTSASGMNFSFGG